MANPDRPSGFRPKGEIKKTIEMTAGARIFPGDCVQLQADGKCDPVAAGATIYGVALSYADADTDKVFVSCDPDQQYIAQTDEADIAAQADIGQMADIVATAGDTTYNLSRQEIDSSTAGAASAQIALLARVPQEDNAFGANVELVCKINEHQIMGEDGSSGV